MLLSGRELGGAGGADGNAGFLTVPLALLYWARAKLSENGRAKTSHPSFQKIRLAQCILSETQGKNEEKQLLKVSGLRPFSAEAPRARLTPCLPFVISIFGLRWRWSQAGKGGGVRPPDLPSAGRSGRICLR